MAQQRDCIFCKIVAGEIPARKVYEDDELLAFWDINPQAPKHFLLIPKKHINRPGEIGPDDALLVGKMIAKAGEIAQKEGLTRGFRLVMNDGDEGGQTVHHLHTHVFGGRRMVWPPG